jgi:hypothetical protein
MEAIATPKTALATARQLASLKIVSRLLAHELHAQSSSKTITLSKDEVVEIQTCIDLYIEEASRRQGGAPALTTVEAPLAVARGN